MTHAYPDAIASQLPSSCDTLALEDLNETAVAGVAYIALNATQAANRASAIECLSVLQNKLAAVGR